MRRAISIICILSFFLANAAFSKVESDVKSVNKDLIRIGVLNYEVESDKKTDSLKIGEFYQLNIDYIKMVSKELGLDIQYVNFNNISDINKALNNSDIDLTFDFSYVGDEVDIEWVRSKPIISGVLAYWSINENKKDTANMNWSCVKGSVYCELLIKRKIKNFKEVNSFAEAIESVKLGNSDGVLSSYISLIQYLNNTDEMNGSLKTPEWGGRVLSRLIAKKENKGLINLFNTNIGKVKFQSTLNNPYLKVDVAYNAYRSSSGQKNTVTFSFNDDAFPLLYRDEQGELTGYIRDILNLIESRTNLLFKFVKPSHDDEHTLTQMLVLGEIDIIPYGIKNENIEKNGNISFTQPFLSFEYFPISLAENINNVNERPLDGVLLAQGKEKLGIRRDLFGEKSKSYKSPKNILLALEQGKIDRAYIREDILKLIMSSHIDGTYVIDRDDVKVAKISMTLKKDKVELKNLINSVLATWDDSEIKKIKNSYDPFNVVYGLDYDSVKQISLIISVVVLFLSGVGLLWFKNLKLQVVIQQNEALNLQQKTQFLQEVILQFPLRVFIHDEGGNLLLTNCDKLIGKVCRNCDIYDVESCSKILNEFERDKVITMNKRINRVVEVEGCPINMKTVRYTCESITVHGLKFVLTILNDITRSKIQEKELITAKQKAEEAISVREKFLASMSHELRTPIAGMLGLTELLKLSLKEDESKMLLDNISASANQLNFLVNDILDFSKLDACELKLDQQDSFILKETSEIIRVHAAVAKDKGLDFDYEVEPTTIELVRLDSSRFTQILNNLLSNAVKFTDKGQIKVKLIINIDDIQVTIIDTGCGMSEEQQKSAFIPFIQADNSTARKYGGTGLGLSIVSELVELMGGSLTINSIAGLGTKVEVKLKHQFISNYSLINESLIIECDPRLKNIERWLEYIYPSENRNKEGMHVLVTTSGNDYDYGAFDYVVEYSSIAENFRKTTETGCKLSNNTFYPDLLFDTLESVSRKHNIKQVKSPIYLKVKVLVAEDNPINQLVFEKQLYELGLKSDLVEDGVQALDKIRSEENKYQLLITDCHMPNMDGFELVNNIRKSDRDYSDIKIIGCTADDSRLVQDKSVLDGFDAMLYKPYGIENLRSIILSLFESEQDSAGCQCWLNNFSLEDIPNILNVFIDSMTEDITKIEESKSEIGKVKKIAHRIKGGASTLGIDAISDKAYELERVCPKLDKEEILVKSDELISIVKTEIKSARQCYRKNYESIIA